MAPQEIESKLADLLHLFPASGFAEELFEAIDPERMPTPHRKLLNHNHHMTVTLEERHSSRVALHVLERRRDGDDYARRLILTAEPSGKVVLAGIMRLGLHHCRQEVRERVAEEREPLGRILIAHNVLRWIEPQAYFRVRLNDAVRGLFRVAGPPAETYGRVATIYCDYAPAVDLLEVVAPEAGKAE